MCEEEDFQDAIARAIKNAVKAFYDTFAEAGFDGGYCAISIDADEVSIDFQSFLRKHHYDNHGEYEQ